MLVKKSLSKKTFWLDSRIAKTVEEGDELKITGYASTGDRDRVGDVIVPDAWTKGGLDNFKKNPIILFNHNYDEPIGRATEIEVDNKGLKLTAVISKSSPQYGLIKDGTLATFSVGFMVRDADYDKNVDGFIIKDAELLETSVVTVPCNQNACFSVAKSFENKDDFRKFLSEQEIELTDGQEAEPNANAAVTDNNGKTGEIETPRTESKRMDPEEIARIAAETAQKMLADRDAAAAKAAEDAANREATEKAIAEKAAEAAAIIVKTETEKLTEGFQKTLEESNQNWEKALGEFKTQFEEKSAEFAAERNSKRHFADRGNKEGWEKTFAQDIDDAFLLGRVTGKRFETNLAKELIEKVNTHSTVTVPSAAYETIASTNIERDIQNELVITPLFREINMNSANMTIPIMPDAGYAEITANTTASGTQPNGNMDRRGAPYGAPYEGITLSEINLNTIKMIALSFLGNETEEDAIIPILPLIRESMIRSHVRGVENMILAGNDVDGVYTSGAKDGLIKLARSGGRMLTTAGTNTPLTAASLFGMRKVMGKYGVNPRDVVYIVSQQAYFELIEDAEFQDADLVGNSATKLNGEIGSVYGSKILMSDEFAAPGAGRFHALALNRRNFVVPRLRGLTVESDYEVREQRRVLVTSQRLGFNEIIPDATSVVGLRYATA